MSLRAVTEFVLRAERVQSPASGKLFHEWAFPNGTLWTQFYRTAEGYLLRFPGLADFEVSFDAWRVICFPAPDVTDATPTHLYLNQVLPLMLGKQGKLVFHASAVEVGGRAVGFMAESGRGKSTLAASFSVNEHRFLTDDGLVVEEMEGGYFALPSHPSIRLWADSEEALVPRGSTPEPPVHFTSKSRFMAGDEIAFCNQPRRLDRVYFLGDDCADVIKFERLGATEALVELVKHSFLLDIEDKALLAFHFDSIAKLAQAPIYYRFDYPRRYDILSHVRQAVVEHALGAQNAN